jgi:hypothetical protein
MAGQASQHASTICACGSPLPTDPDIFRLLDYQYQRLSLPKSFRALTLLPGVGADPVCVNILELSLTDDDPQASFDALSYTWQYSDSTLDSVSKASSTTKAFAWENIKKPHVMIINEVSKMYVTCSVNSALTRLRSSSQEICVFVDAICIDQGTSTDSLKERAVQVRSMGTIYSKAGTVFADLGDNEDGGSAVVEHIRNFAELEDDMWEQASGSPEDFAALVSSRFVESMTPAAWDSFLALCTRKWWRRIWILQEIVLARKAVFYINREIIDREDLMKGLRRLWRFHNYYNNIAATRGLKPLAEQVQSRIYTDCFLPCVSFTGILGWKQQEAEHFLNGTPLIQIIALTETFNSTVLHDQIYALLGLGTQADRDDILVDYSLPYKTVLVNFSQHVIRSGHLYYLFHKLGWVTSELDLPSWTLEPMLKNQRDTLDSSIFYGDTFDSYDAGGGTAPPVAFDETGMLLSVDGIHIGSLDVITASPYPLTGQQSWKEISEWCVDARRIFSCYPSRTGRLTKDDFWTTLCAGRRLRLAATGADLEKLNDYAYIFSNALDERTLPFPAQGHEKEWHQYYNYINTICQGRRFGITEQGHLALVPGHTRTGDKIAVLLGSRFPFVIRLTDQGTYRLIGSAFVLGFMDGEALQLEDRHRETMVFE